jgi:hypothetical protein
MKKSILTPTMLIFLLLAINTNGQILKKNADRVTKSTGYETQTFENPDSIVVHKDGAPSSSDLAKMMTQIEKLKVKVEQQEKYQLKLETSLSSVQSDVRSLNSTIEIDRDSLKAKFTNTANLIGNSKEQEILNELESQQASADIEVLKDRSKIQGWVNWGVGFCLIGVLIFILFQWRQKIKMGKTLDQIMYTKYPEHAKILNTRSDGFGFPIGSTGPESLHLKLNSSKYN